jgi:hypothetical protein
MKRLKDFKEDVMFAIFSYFILDCENKEDMCAAGVKCEDSLGRLLHYNKYAICEPENGKYYLHFNDTRRVFFSILGIDFEPCSPEILPEPLYGELIDDDTSLNFRLLLLIDVLGREALPLELWTVRIDKRIWMSLSDILNFLTEITKRSHEVVTKLQGKNEFCVKIRSDI